MMWDYPLGKRRFFTETTTMLRRNFLAIVMLMVATVEPEVGAVVAAAATAITVPAAAAASAAATTPRKRNPNPNKGIVFVVCPVPEANAAQVAGPIADALGLPLRSPPQLPNKPNPTELVEYLDELAKYELEGGVIFYNPTDKVSDYSKNIANLLNKLPDAGAHYVLTFAIDCNDVGFEAHDQMQKRATGMTDSALTNLSKFTGAKRFNHYRESGCEDFGKLIKDVALKCSAEYSQWLSEVKPPEFRPVKIVTFATLPGMGKSSLAKTLIAKLATQFDRAPNKVVHIEKDRFKGKEYENAFDAALKNGAELVILDRNCPPNSWGSVNKMIKQLCRKHGVKPTLYVAYPEDTTGGKNSGNGFSLLDLAVCAEGALNRDGHPTKFDKSNDDSAAILGSFFQFNKCEGREEFFNSIRQNFTLNVVPYRLLDSGRAAEFLASPEWQEIKPVVEKLATLDSEKTPSDVKAAVTAEVKQKLAEHGPALKALRVTSEETAQVIADSISSIEAVPGIVEPFEYFAIFFEDGTHTTLFHKNDAPNPEMVAALRALVRTEAQVQVIGQAKDEECECRHVEIVTEGVPCNREYPHITDWTEEGTAPAYANVLLASGEGYTSIPDGETLIGTIQMV